MYDYAKLAVEYEAGLSAPEVARRNGCGRTSVHRARELFGVEARYTSYRRKQLPTSELIASYRSGVSCADLAALHNCNPSTVQRHLRRAGEPLRTRMEAARTLRRRRKISAAQRGIPLESWAKFDSRPRRTPQYRKWRLEVLRRDGECVICGGRRSLQVHHILTVAAFPGLVHDPFNGVSLCKVCHRGIKCRERVYAAYFEYRLRGYFENA